MQPEDALAALPGYPFTAYFLVVLVLAAGAVRTWQNRPQKQSATNQRLGARLQVVEQQLKLDRTRRLQVEHELTRRGLVLPYWPGDPIPPDAYPMPDDELDDDEHLADEPPETAQRVTVPPLPNYPRHRRSATT